MAAADEGGIMYPKYGIFVEFIKGNDIGIGLFPVVSRQHLIIGHCKLFARKPLTIAHWYLYTNVYGVTYQKTAIFTFKVM
jgi:hypothetical protein